jgi:hypothetical protein
MEYRRTTLMLEESLYRQAKREALEQDKTFKQIVEQALTTFLRGGERLRARSRRLRFGVSPGKPLKDLRRKTLYQELKK